MVKRVKVGKYLNSPPSQICYYPVKDFDKFVDNYVKVIHNKFKAILLFDNNKFTVKYPDYTYIYTNEG